MLVICPISICAERQPMEISSHIAGLDIQQATVILVPPSWLSYARLNEETLRKIGCVYNTSDKKFITDLKSILERNDIKTAIGSHASFELRNGIFLTLADGTTVKWLFGQKYSGQSTVPGTFNHLPAYKDLSFTAADSLPKDLTNWALEANILDVQNAETRANCAREMHP